MLPRDGMGEKDRLLQYTQPPRPMVPSRLGQLNPASTVIFCIFPSKRSRRKSA